jgi:hypothetical protein
MAESGSKKASAAPWAAAFGLRAEAAARDPDEADVSLFNQLTSVGLSREERRLAARPDRTAPRTRRFLAVHWHPEWAPLDLIHRRLAAAFPRAEDFLAIPTQHNRVLAFGSYAGVEADAFDRDCGLKVQLLIHFKADRLPRAGTFLSMMDRTYNYRARQLLDILDLLASSDREGLPAARAAGPDGEKAWLVARFYALRLRELIDRSGLIGTPRDEMLKNRLLPDFLTARAGPGLAHLLPQALDVVRAVKKKVKSALNPEEFYSPREIIEEARALGAGLVIPHPPAFWPVLLADLDVDGWEIWNPSTPSHALFLSRALARANEGRRRRLLAFMGDDTHLSAKFRPGLSGEKNSADREIGFQDPWADPALEGLLASTGQSLARTLAEYRARLG